MGKSKYDYWLTKEGLVELQNMKIHDGLTDAEIAQKIGVGPDTISKWRKRFPKINQALKTGKTIAIAHIRNKLYERALEGNLTAIIFYLKNNDRNNYNDSALSAEERQIAKEKIRKMKADAEISEFKAQMLKQSNGNGTIKIDVGVGDWNDED